VDAEIDSQFPIIEDHLVQCLVLSEVCFRNYTEEDIIPELSSYFSRVGRHSVYHNYHAVIVDGAVSLDCATTLNRHREFDSYFNSYCTVGVLETCVLHSDCSQGSYCGMMKTWEEGSAVCLECEGCCSPESAHSLSAAHPSEPGCGHCPCQSCSPGCTLALLLNHNCDPACFTLDCAWDSGHCAAELLERSLACPVDTLDVTWEDDALGTLGACCTLEDPNENSKVITIEVFSHSSKGAADSLELNITEANATHTIPRFVAATNRIVAGVLLHLERFTAGAECSATNKFGNLYDSCRGSPNTQPYGVDPVFQSGTSLFSAEAADKLGTFYARPSDLNEFGIPFGFHSMPLAGMEDGYPFLFDVNLDAARAAEFLTYLSEGNFLSEAKKLTVRFLTFNGNFGVFARMKVMFTFLKTGAIAISHDVQMVNGEMYTSAAQVLRGALECLFVIGWLINVFGEVYEIRSKGLVAHFRSMANFLDAVSLGLGGAVILVWVAIVMGSESFRIEPRYNVYKAMYQEAHWLELKEGGRVLEQLGKDFESLEVLTSLTQVYMLLNSLNIILMLARLLRLMDFHPDIGMVTRTIRQAGSDLINFCILALGIILVYSLMAHILLGPYMPAFYTFAASMQTCLLFMVGEFGDLSSETENLDPATNISLIIVFWTYMVLVYLILLSALLGIIVGAMDEIKSAAAARESTHILSELTEMSVYLWLKWTSYLPTWGRRLLGGGSKIEESKTAASIRTLANQMRLTEEGSDEAPGDAAASSRKDSCLVQVGFRACSKQKLERILRSTSESLQNKASSDKQQTSILMDPSEPVSLQDFSAIAEVVCSHLGRDADTVHRSIQSSVQQDMKQNNIQRRMQDTQWRASLGSKVIGLETQVAELGVKFDALDIIVRQIALKLNCEEVEKPQKHCFDLSNSPNYPEEPTVNQVDDEPSLLPGATGGHFISPVNE